MREWGLTATSIVVGLAWYGVGRAVVLSFEIPHGRRRMHFMLTASQSAIHCASAADYGHMSFRRSMSRLLFYQHPPDRLTGKYTLLQHRDMISTTVLPPPPYQETASLTPSSSGNLSPDIITLQRLVEVYELYRDAVPSVTTCDRATNRATGTNTQDPPAIDIQDTFAETLRSLRDELRRALEMRIEQLMPSTADETGAGERSLLCSLSRRLKEWRHRDLRAERAVGNGIGFGRRGRLRSCLERT